MNNYGNPHQLPRWQCHKVVRAAKITHAEAMLSGALYRLTLDGVGVPIEVDTKWMVERRAEAGGYLVVYEDGYMSFSPAKAFEEGYTRLETETVTARVEPGPDPFPPLLPGFGGEP